jgi:hypothetical protein
MSVEPQPKQFLTSIAGTRFLDAGGVRYAYRAFGPEGCTPLSKSPTKKKDVMNDDKTSQATKRD